MSTQNSFFSVVERLGFERTEINRWTLENSLLQFSLNSKTHEVDVEYNAEEVGSYSPAEFIRLFPSIRDYYRNL